MAKWHLRSDDHWQEQQKKGPNLAKLDAHIGYLIVV